MKKENIYQGKRYTLTMNINEAPIDYPASVLASYGNLCLVEEQRAYTAGPYNQYGIYRVLKNIDSIDYLDNLMIDYSKDPLGPRQDAAPNEVVKAKFDTMVAQIKLAKARAEEVAKHKAEAAEIAGAAKQAADKREAEYIKRQDAITALQAEINVKLGERAKAMYI